MAADAHLGLALSMLLATTGASVMAIPAVVHGLHAIFPDIRIFGVTSALMSRQGISPSLFLVGVVMVAYAIRQVRDIHRLLKACDESYEAWSTGPVLIWLSRMAKAVSISARPGHLSVVEPPLNHGTIERS